MALPEGYQHGPIEGERAATGGEVVTTPRRTFFRNRLVVALLALCGGSCFWVYTRFEQTTDHEAPRAPIWPVERPRWARQFVSMTASVPLESTMNSGEAGSARPPMKVPLEQAGPLPPAFLTAMGPASSTELPDGGPTRNPAGVPPIPTVSVAPAKTNGAVLAGSSENLDSSDSALLAEAPESHDRENSIDSARSSELLGRTYATVAAKILPNRDFLLAAGSTIECVLQTRLDSTLPGMTSCLVTRRVLSDTGRIVLLDRGSLITGEYRSNVTLGQRRLFVLWRRAKTPSGVVIDLESPATDPLGGAGVEGELDEHWGKRVGAALLLSVVQDGLAYAVNARSTDSESGTTIVLPSTTQTGNQMAGKVLESTIGIAPTLTKAQGEKIMIFVARDLYFDAVYDVSVVRAEP